MASPLLRLKALIPIALLSLAASSVNAQSRQQGDGALSYKLGETDLYPSVRVGFLQNSNAYREQENVTIASDLKISPELVWVADRRLLSLEGSYIGNYGVSSEEVLNFADHRLALDVNAELTSRKRLSGGLSLDFGHEELGTNLTRGVVQDGDEPVRFTEFQASGAYRYGANGARGNVSVGLLLENLDYTSRNDVTSGLGFIRFEPFAEFSLRLSGDTRLLSEIRFGSYNYENSRKNRNDLSLLTGMQFAATGKSGGAIRFGVLQSQPELASNESQTLFVTRASLFWEPTSFSRFELEGRRELDNRGSSLVNADAVAAVEDLVTVRWKHQWSSRLSHVALVQSRNVARDCPDLDTNWLSGNVELNLQIRRWLSVGVSGSSTTRGIPGCEGTEDADPNLDFQRNRIGAYVRATL